METKEMLSTKKPTASKYVMAIFGWGVFIITLFVFLVSFNFGYDVLVQKVNEAMPVFALWRLFMFLALIIGWQHWIDKLSQWMNLSDAQKTFYLNYKWRFALWILVIEVLLIQNVLSKFFALFIN